jgi:hypothetical protein
MSPALPSDFPPTVDLPPGHLDRVRSRITGKVSTTFTPDPLPTMLARCALDRHATPAVAHPDPLLLVRAVATRQGSVDPAMIALLARILLRPPGLLDGDALRAVSPTCTSRMRAHLGFLRVRVASQADVFADAALVPERFGQLATGIATAPANFHPAVFAACIGFNATHLHPFRDGNGRWSRSVVVLASHHRKDAFAGMAHAALLARGKARLVARCWPAARKAGLRDYLARCVAFEHDLAAVLADATPSFAAITDGVTRMVRTRAARERMLVQLCTAQCIARSALKDAAESSQRALDAWCRDLQARSLEGVEVARDVVRVDGVFAAVNAQVDALVEANFASTV